ncbi:MAG TPA: hypothetical protein PLR60_06700 [Syntrophorhabdaceae bacterium]|nr:hypothetical protein [Syntrophorhabdaceae bacterium]
MDNKNQADRSNKKTWFRANRSLLIMLLVIFVLFVLFSLPRICSYARNYILAWKSPYKVVDSETWPVSDSITKVLWLDNDRVFFHSNERMAPAKSPRRGVVWDTKKKTVSLSIFLGDYNESGNVVCVRDDGQVLFYKKDKDTGKRSYCLGSIDGESKEHPLPNADMVMDARFDCDWVTRKKYVHLPAFHKLRGENYLEIVKYGKEDLSRKWHPGKLLYHEREGAKPVEMPFETEAAGFSHYVAYSSILDAYVAYQYGNPVDPATGRYWILKRDGTFTGHAYPRTMPKQSIHALFPVRRGYLVHGSGGKRITYSDSGDAGLYLMDGDQYQMLIKGNIHQIAISPDGCKVAFEHARSIEESSSRTRPYRTMKMVDLCKQGGSR